MFDICDVCAGGSSNEARLLLLPLPFPLTSPYHSYSISVSIILTPSHTRLATHSFPLTTVDSNNNEVSGKLLEILLEGMVPSLADSPPTPLSLLALNTLAMHAKIRLLICQFYEKLFSPGHLCTLILAPSHKVDGQGEGTFGESG